MRRIKAYDEEGYTVLDAIVGEIKSIDIMNQVQSNPKYSKIVIEPYGFLERYVGTLFFVIIFILILVSASVN